MRSWKVVPEKQGKNMSIRAKTKIRDHHKEFFIPLLINLLKIIASPFKLLHVRAQFLDC